MHVCPGRSRGTLVLRRIRDAASMSLQANLSCQRPRVRLFAPRDKVHLVGTSADLDSRNHNTVRGRLVILGAQMKRGRPTRPVAWKASGTAIVYVNAAARSVSDGPSLPPPPAAPPRTPGSCSSASPAIERGLAYFKRIASVLAKAALGLRLNEHITADSPTVFAHACKMGLEGIVSKRKASTYRSGRSPDWLKSKNPACEAVRREAEEDWDHR